MNASMRHACETAEPQQNSSPRCAKCIPRSGAVQHLQQDSKPKRCDDAVFGLVFGLKFKLWHRHVQVSFLEKREGHALALSFPRASPSSLARGSADIKYNHMYIVVLSVNLVCMWLHTPLCFNYSCPWGYDHPIPINTGS